MLIERRMRDATCALRSASGGVWLWHATQVKVASNATPARAAKPKRCALRRAPWCVDAAGPVLLERDSGRRMPYNDGHVRRKVQARMPGSKVKRALIGIDGGGTKTRACVFVQADAELRLLDFDAVSAASNPLAVGPEKAQEAILDCVEQLEAELAKRALESGEPAARIEGLGLGLAGAAANRVLGERLTASISAARGGCAVALASDLITTLCAAFSGEAGALVIGGTGSVAIAFDGSALRRAGGWGKRLGDCGGAYDLLRTATQFLLAVREGRTPAPAAGQVGRVVLDAPDLSERLVSALGLSSIDDLVKVFARDPSPDEVARGVRAIVEAEGAGNATAGMVFDSAAASLSELAESVMCSPGAAASQGEQLTSLVLHGGVLSGIGAVRERFDRAMGERWERAAQAGHERRAFEICEAAAGPERGAVELLIATGVLGDASAWLAERASALARFASAVNESDFAVVAARDGKPFAQLAP